MTRRRRVAFLERRKRTNAPHENQKKKKRKEKEKMREGHYAQSIRSQSDKIILREKFLGLPLDPATLLTATSARQKHPPR